MQLDIKLGFVDGNEITLPLQYNHIVQAMIYNSMGKDLAGFLHDSGFINEKRSFKMFTFSKLCGEYKISGDKQRITFKDSIDLVLSSPMEKFCTGILNNLFLKDELRLGNNILKVSELKGRKPKLEGDFLEFETISPIVTYSTLVRADGRKYTCYFQPGEPDFIELAHRNLVKKYKAFYDKEAPSSSLKLTLKGRPRQNVVRYKNFIIKGYSGKFALKGPKDLLQMGLDAGLGSKNSQGFGCIKQL